MREEVPVERGGAFEEEALGSTEASRLLADNADNKTEFEDVACTPWNTSSLRACRIRFNMEL